MSETPSTEWKESNIYGYSPSLKWSPDGKMFVAVHNGDIIVVNVEDMSIQHKIEVSSQIYRVAWNPTKNMIAACFKDGLIKLWDPITGELLLTIVAQLPQVWDFGGIGVGSIAFSPDGTKIVSGSAWQESKGTENRPIKIWDISNYNTHKMETPTPEMKTPTPEMETPTPEMKTPTPEMKTPTPEMKTPTPEITTPLLEMEKKHNSAVENVEWCPNKDRNLILSCSWRGNINIWNSETGKIFKELVVHDEDGNKNGHVNHVYTVAWNKSNVDIIATGSRDKTVIIWNINNGDIIKKFNASNWVQSVTFSTDGTKIASGENKDFNGKSYIHMWDIDSENKLYDLECYGDIDSVEFSPDNNKILAGTENSIRMFEKPLGGGGVSSIRSMQKDIRKVRRAKHSNKKRKNSKKRKSYRKFYKKN
jgi:hypothetical protein